jgi:hypothetical protein
MFECSVTAWSQNCAMCYNSAAAAKASGIEALKQGILILLIPPLAMFIGIFALAFRRRNRFNQNIEATEEDRSLDASFGRLSRPDGMLGQTDRNWRARAESRV